MARTVLETPGEDVGVFGGQFDVFGTTSGGEEITILSGTDVWLDPSFNTGGDTIRLPGEAEEYTAYVDGSYVILESTVNDVTVMIPVGPAGITVVFGGDDSRSLYFDTVDNRVEIDGEPIDGSADPLSPGDDAPPPPPTTYTVLADSPTVTEGDSGTRMLTYTITLDQPAEEDVTITYTTVGGGSAEINDDYTPVTGTVTIPAGSTTAFVSVPVFGDTMVEGDETINLQLSGPDLEATQVLSGTIIDDDAAPPPPVEYNLSINSPTVTEGDSGVRGLTYTVTLDQPADQDVVLTYMTVGGTATENDDYSPVTGTVIIPAGSTTAFITVPVLGDTDVEGDETVELQVNSVDAAAAVVGVGTIINDDEFVTEFNLNPGSETINGTPDDDSFRASNNELGAGDVVNGLEGNDTLQVFVDENAAGFGSIDYRAFETNSVENFLVTNDSPESVEIDMSGAEGVELVGSVNSSNDVEFYSLTDLADILVEDITFAGGTDVRVYYQESATDGGNDSVTLNVTDSDVDDIEIGSIDNFDNRTNSGIETVNLMLSGDSEIVDLDTDLTTLNIDGTGDLEIVDELNTTVRTIDASGLVGDLDIDFSDNSVGVVYDGSSGDNVVDAGDGSDDIETQGGDDLVFGNGGNDDIDTNAGDDSVYAGSGDDDVDLGTGNNYADLGSGNDFATATEADGVTLAGGYNVIEAGIGNDTVVLGDGGSWVDLAAGDDNATLGAGADVVFTGSGYENISTGGGDDYVYAYGNFAGDDSALLGRQDDIIAFGAGTDALVVDAGTVDLDYQNVSGLEWLILNTSGMTVLGVEAQQAGIVRIYGTAGNDNIDASAFTSALTVYPSSGDDIIATGSANDTFIFYGGQLDDTDILDANGGTADALTLFGYTTVATGANIDDFEVLNLENSGSIVDDDYVITTDAGWVGVADGVLTVNGGGLQSNDDVILDATAGDYSVDATTGAGADIIVTSFGVYDDCIDSGAGDDYVETLSGDDDIATRAGNDTVLGGFGDDDMHLGTGDDYADGDIGADRFFGDTGADVFWVGGDTDVDTIIYANVDDSANRPGLGRDTINDFDSGEDVIDISELLANNGIDSGDTEFISAQDLDAAEAQMVSGDGIYSIVFIENLPGEPTDAVDDTTGFFFVDLNDDGELGGEDLQVFVNGDDVTAGDVDTALNLSGQSGYDLFLMDHCAFA